MNIFTTHRISFADLSPSLQKNFRRWSTLNNMQIHYFDDEGMNSFMSRHCRPLECKAYNELTTGAAKSDMFRLLYLIRHGGLWVDMDIEPINLSEQCTYPLFLRGLSLYEFFGVNRPRYDIIGSQPNNTILKATMEDVVHQVLSHATDRAINITGPFVFQRTLCRFHASHLCRGGRFGGTRSSLHVTVYPNFTYSRCNWSRLSFSKRREWKTMNIQNWRYFKA